MYNRLLATTLQRAGAEGETIKLILSFVTVSWQPLGLLQLSVACQLHQEEDEEERITFTRDEIASCPLMVIIQGE